MTSACPYNQQNRHLVCFGTRGICSVFTIPLSHTREDKQLDLVTGVLDECFGGCGVRAAPSGEGKCFKCKETVSI